MTRTWTRFFTEDRYAYFFIMLNGFALFCLGFAEDPGGQLNDKDPLYIMIWEWIDYVCVVYFLIEAITKIRTKTWAVYWGDHWDRFDFLVLIPSLPVLLAPVFYLGQFHVATIMRLGRLFRLIRLLRIIPNRDHLARGIWSAMKTSVGVFLALFLLILILSLGATFIFGPHAPEYFGNPLLSFYTTFKVFTVEGWHEIPDAMVSGEGGGIWAVGVRLFFMASVLVCGILGLSLANAVFVDEMVMDNTNTIDDKIDVLLEEMAGLRAEIAELRARADGE